MTDTTPQYGQRYSADAYPISVYCDNQHIRPADIRVEATDRAITIWEGGRSISVDRAADDTRLYAALDTAYVAAQSWERYGALIRAVLQQRIQERADAAHDAAQEAARRAAEQQAERTHPYAEPAAEPHPGDTVVHPIPGPA